MDLQELKKQVEELTTSKSYCKTKRESIDEYASRVASVIHKGWSFMGLGRSWFDKQVAEIRSLLTEDGKLK